MGVEFSELATLAATMFPKRKLIEASSNKDKFLKFADDLKKMAGSRKVVFTDNAAKKMYMDAFDTSDPKVLADVAVSISAALSIKNWLTSTENEPRDIPVRGFMTGNRWPSEVDKFRIDSFGMKDYNSSDIILYTGKQSGNEYYYGISLKKKPTAASQDPTIINKAFDSIMQGNKFDKVKEKLEETRNKWFADKLRQAHKERKIQITDSDKRLSDAELIRKKPPGSNKSYVDTKGTLSEGYENGNGFREWMNKQVSDGSSRGLYAKLMKEIEPYMDLYANSLINLVLKTKLNDELNANKELNKYYFGFCLCTGVGRYSERTGPSVGTGSCYSQDSVLASINKIMSSRDKLQMKMVPNPAGPGSDAAKVFFEITKGRFKILDLELRYKGSFTSQPQFFAKLSPEFKKTIKGK